MSSQEREREKQIIKDIDNSSKNEIKLFEEICDNIYNGNWEDATTVALNNGFDIYRLYKMKNKIQIPANFEIASDRKLGILGTYIERKRLR